MIEVKRKLSVAALIKIQAEKDNMQQAVIAVACCCEMNEKDVLEMDAVEFMKLSEEALKGISGNEKKS